VAYYQEPTLENQMERVGIIGKSDCLNDVVFKLPIGTELFIRKHQGFDECAASGQSCDYITVTSNGEKQCKYCGKQHPDML
jgi:hypothetical protein